MATSFDCYANGQEVAVEVVEVVEQAEEAVEVGDVLVELALPADKNQLKLMAYANVELALVRRVCDLTEEQITELAELDEDWVRTVIRQPVNQAQANQQRPGLIAMFFGARPAGNRVREMTSSKGRVKTIIDDQIAKVLTDEQLKVYEQEKELRARFRNEAIADALLESLQPRLGMTEDQRAEIKSKLVPWAAKSNLNTMHYFSGNNYYPAIPEHFLSQCLDEDQMTAYRSLQKHLFTEENFDDGHAPIVIKQ
jgi:hypothetical protein